MGREGRVAGPEVVVGPARLDTAVHVEDQIRDVIGDLSASLVHAGQDHVLVELGVAAAAPIRRDPLTPLDPKMREQVPRLGEGDPSGCEICGEVRPEHLVHTAEAAPVAAEALEIPEQPERLHGLAEG